MTLSDPVAIRQFAELPPPYVFGLPAKFNRWWPNQSEAVMRTVETKKRFVGIVAPTGFGKSMVAIAIARIVGGRACYLTESKPLATQISRDFAALVTDVRGRQNYDCHRLNENGIYGASGKCDRAEGLCPHCTLQENGCGYFDAWRRASRADLPITNYDYWLSINEYNEKGLGKFDLLLVDEAHDAAQKLLGHLRIEFSAPEIGEYLRRDLPRPGTMTIERWRSWAQAHAPGIRTRADALKMQAQFGGELPRNKQIELRVLTGLAGRLEALSGIDDAWIEDRERQNPLGRVWWEPLTPARYAERLFRGIPKIVLLSATITPKDLEILGIPKSETEWLEFPSSFPVARRPVIHVPTVQQRASMSEGQRLESVRRMDQIIRARLDRKGVVHTVSYERQTHFVEHSEHRAIILTNQARSTQTTLDRYLKSAPPAVLSGPSYGTGYDFPGVSAEYQIIPKVPFMDTRSAIESARVAADPEYRNFMAMKSIVQMAGRIVRSAGDSGETFITDDQWLWFRWQAVRFAPRYFLEACVFAKSIPAPLAKL